MRATSPIPPHIDAQPVLDRLKRQPQPQSHAEPHDRLFLTIDGVSMQAMVFNDRGVTLALVHVDTIQYPRIVNECGLYRCSESFSAFDNLFQRISKIEIDGEKIIYKIMQINGSAPSKPYLFLNQHCPTAKMNNLSSPLAELFKGASIRTSDLTIMQLVEQENDDLFRGIDRIVSEPMLLEGLLCGVIPQFTLRNALATRLYNSSESKWIQLPRSPSVAPSERNERHRKLVYCLGQVDRIAKNDSPPLISSYHVRRYGFNPGCQIMEFVTQSVAESESITMRNDDVLLDFGRINDKLIIKSDRLSKAEHEWTLDYSVNGNVSLGSINAYDTGLARNLIRSQFCNEQIAIFDYLVDQTPHGGSIGLDNKVFAVVIPSNSMTGKSMQIDRFVRGQRVTEFNDEKLNPRIILEGELLALRIIISRLLASKDRPSLSSNSALSFDPFLPVLSPSRIILLESSSPEYKSASIHRLVATVLGAPIFKINDETNIRDGDVKPSRAVIGSSRMLLQDYHSRIDGLPSPNTPSTSTLGSALTDLTRDLSFDEKATNSTLPQTSSSLRRSNSSGERVTRLEANTGLTLLASPRMDVWRFYGGMLEEYERLRKLV